jgi:hypothetical protein
LFYAPSFILPLLLHIFLKYASEGMRVAVLTEGIRSSKHSPTIQSSFSPLVELFGKEGGGTYVVTSSQKADALNLQRVHNLLNVMNLY